MRTRYFSDQTASRNPPAFHPASIVPPCRFCLEQLPDQPTPRVSLDNITIQYLKSNFNYLPRSNRDKSRTRLSFDSIKIISRLLSETHNRRSVRSSSSTRVVISQFAISLSFHSVSRAYSHGAANLPVAPPSSAVSIDDNVPLRGPPPPSITNYLLGNVYTGSVAHTGNQVERANQSRCNRGIIESALATATDLLLRLCLSTCSTSFLFSLQQWKER